MTEREFVAEWDMETIPACAEGMALLKLSGMCPQRGYAAGRIDLSLMTSMDSTTSVSGGMLRPAVSGVERRWAAKTEFMRNDTQHT